MFIIQMGCGVSFSTRKSSPKFMSKVNKGSLASNNSVKTTADLNESQSLTPKLSKSCYRKPPEELDGSDIIENYSILQSLCISCAEEYKSVKELTSSFLYYYSYFLFHVHSSCIPRFRISKALKVLMAFVYCKRSTQEDQIILCNKFPFFSVFSNFAEDYQIIDELLYLTKHLKKSDKFLQDLLKVEYVLKIFSNEEDLVNGLEDGVNILRKCAEEARYVMKIIENIYKETQEFFWEYWNFKVEALQIAGQFKGIKDCSIEDIVHFMYMENLITM